MKHEYMLDEPRFKNAVVGDRVFCTIYGPGSVGLLTSEPSPDRLNIVVEPDNSTFAILYTIKGCLLRGDGVEEITLSYLN